MLLGTVPIVNRPASESDVDSGRREAGASAEPLSAELAAALSVASKAPRRGAAGAAAWTARPADAGCAGAPLLAMPSVDAPLVNDVVKGVIDDEVAEEDAMAANGVGKPAARTRRG